MLLMCHVAHILLFVVAIVVAIGFAIVVVIGFATRARGRCRRLAGTDSRRMVREPNGYATGMTITAPDLNTTVPRSGRERLGAYTWLARLADKARAEQAGTGGEYTAYCGLSTGFLDRAGVSIDAFRKLIHDGASDADLVRYFDEHVDAGHRDAANTYVLEDMKFHLDKQDAEEGR